MKRNKSFFFFIAMLCFILCYTTTVLISCRTVEILNLTMSGAVLVYPLTYFIAIVFAERYSNEDAKMMFNYSIVSLIFMMLLITVTSVLPYNAPDGLEAIFNIDYRFIFASMAAFYTTQHLCLYLYNYLSGFKGFRFLIAAVISITVDNIIYIALAYFGELPFIEILKMFVGQYVFSILAVILYAVFFTYFIDSVKKEKTEITKETKSIKRNTKKSSKK